MKLKELRIGNYIEYDNNSSHVLVTGMFGVDVYYNSSCRSPINTMNAIVLTKEWLLKFKFRKVNKISELYLLKINDISIYINLLNVGNNPQWKVEFRHKNNPYKIIDYVHQLQNSIHYELEQELLL